MRLYKIADKYIKYIKYLSNFDNKVSFNKSEKRPYIGIILEINDYKYFAPLSSPKNKHLKMKNRIDFIKLKNGELGVINLNNMIPVLINCLIIFDILEEENKAYRNLLINQQIEIRKIKTTIFKNTEKLYAKRIADKPNKYLIDNCIDFKLLEQKTLEYK